MNNEIVTENEVNNNCPNNNNDCNQLWCDCEAVEVSPVLADWYYEVF